MLKPTASFKLSKTTKRILALTKFSSQDQRNAWKRSMIQAELASLIQPKRERSRREDKAE